MANLFRKAAGLFVDLPPQADEAPLDEQDDTTAVAPEAGPVQVEVPTDLAEDPDFMKVQNAISLLDQGVSSDAALKTMKAFGLNPSDLMAAFQRTTEELKGRIARKKTAIENRQSLNQSRMTTLQQAMDEEKATCAQEIETHTQAINQGGRQLEQVMKAAVAFEGETGGPNG